MSPLAAPATATQPGPPHPLLPALPNVARRPTPVNERAELGQGEADQIIGARNRSSLLTLTERVTCYPIAVTMPDGYSADAVVAGLIDGLDRVPGHLLRSITFDQGSECADWAIVAGHDGIDAWSSTHARPGSAARSRTRTAPGAGGSPAAPTSPSSNPPTSTTSPTSSTTSAMDLAGPSRRSELRQALARRRAPHGGDHTRECGSVSDAKATVYKAVDYCHILRDDGLAYDLKGEALDGKEETA